MGYPWSRVKVKAPGQSSFPSHTPVFLGPNRRLTQPSSPDTSSAVPEASEEGSKRNLRAPSGTGSMHRAFMGSSHLHVPRTELSLLIEGHAVYRRNQMEEASPYPREL